MMELSIRYQDEVWTKDNLKLGIVDRIYHRPVGVDPDVKYYDRYLHIEDYELGMTYYIPTDFIVTVDPTGRRVTLSTTRKQVMHNTWDRTPNFVAAGDAEVQNLEPAIVL